MTEFFSVLPPVEALHRLVELLPGPHDFLDPRGNRIRIVGYENVQFMKDEYVLKRMGLEHVKQSASAIEELNERGMTPPGES